MTRPALLEPCTAAVLAHMLAADQPLTAMEIGRESWLYPRGTPQTWAELGASLVRPLLEHRLAHKAGRKPMRYEISERGRIALALFKVIAGRKLVGGGNGQSG